MLIEDLFTAYYQARKNKRNTINSLEFEFNLEENIFQLYEDIINRNYELKPSICFINEYPVKREIFAADFRDRVVHHLIYNYIQEIFEKIFIYDSYSCRKRKGTLFGIKRLDKFIRSCSKNYKQDCYILKLDIRGYFMSIDKRILYQKLNKILLKNRKEVKGIEFSLLDYLIKKVIFNDPIKSCQIKGRKENWVGLPKDKSLFFSGRDKGLPIGNLTSQLFSNIYLHCFDCQMKHCLGCRYYGRYVDDFFVISTNKNFLKQIILEVERFLKTELELTLHQNKIYLQHFSKGVDFLGGYIKPHRIYIKNKTKGNFYKLIKKWNNSLNNKKPSEIEISKFINKSNSYLGTVGQFKTKKLRRRMLDKISPVSYKYFYIKDFSDRCLLSRK